MNDIFEKLAELDVSVPPEEFDQKLAQRLNSWLLAQHLIDFVFGAVPSVMVDWTRTIAAWFVYTLTGKY